jgi:hypothetical protein
MGSKRAEMCYDAVHRTIPVPATRGRITAVRVVVWVVITSINQGAAENAERV